MAPEAGAQAGALAGAWPEHTGEGRRLTPGTLRLMTDPDLPALPKA